MSIAEHKETVRRYIAAGNARDFALLDALRAPDFLAHVPSGGSIADSEPIGAAVLNRDLAMVVGAFPDLVNVEQDIVAEGDRVVVRARLSGTHRGDLGGVAATHRTISWDTVHVYRVAGGKIAEAWFVTDTLGLLRQADAVTVHAGTVQQPAGAERSAS